METINMTYQFADETTNSQVRMTKNDTEDCGLNANDICEMFCDFMEAAGFSIKCIYRYFGVDED